MICKNSEIIQADIDFESNLLTVFEEEIENTKEKRTIEKLTRLIPRKTKKSLDELESDGNIQSTERDRNNKLLKVQKFVITKIFQKFDGSDHEKVTIIKTKLKSKKKSKDEKKIISNENTSKKQDDKIADINSKFLNDSHNGNFTEFLPNKLHILEEQTRTEKKTYEEEKILIGKTEINECLENKSESLFTASQAFNKNENVINCLTSILNENIRSSPSPNDLNLKQKQSEIRITKEDVKQNELIIPKKKKFGKNNVTKITFGAF